MRNLSLRLLLSAAFIISCGFDLSADILMKPVFTGEVIYQKKRALEMVRYRNGILIRTDLAFDDAIKYVRYGSKKADPVKIGGIEYCLGVEQTAEGVLFLGISADEQMRIVQEAPDGKQQIVDVPVETFPKMFESRKQVDSVRLISTPRGMALAVGQTVWWKDEEWTKVTLPAVPKFYSEFNPEGLGHTLVLDGTTLYAGWDRGEWGGMLVSIDLKADDPKWVHLSGKRHGDTSGIPKNNSVSRSIAMVDRHLWVATGSSMLNYRGLFRRGPNGQWLHLLDDDCDEKWNARGKFKLPQPNPKLLIPDEISALNADPKGRIHLVAPQHGVFRASESGIETVFYHDFTQYQEKKESSIIFGHPTDLELAGNGDIFVSMNAFGILAFRKNGETWSAHQVTID